MSEMMVNMPGYLSWQTVNGGVQGPQSASVEYWVKWAKKFIAQHETSPADRTLEEQAIISKTICIDFDDTLAVGLWQPDNPTHEIGPTITTNLAKAKKLVADGWHLVIYTARGWEDEARIERWCQENELPILRVVCGKPIALAYIDDRSVHESQEVWGPVRRVTEP